MLPPLTPRQLQIAELVARGLTDKRIAKTIGVSPSTVAAHVRDAAERIPGDGRARWKLIMFIVAKPDES